jgi:hypothetical protein
MFSAHSPGTYDRAPIIVSPNPLALPDWGDRIYSPTLNGFNRALASPQPFPMSYNSPTIAGFEDPRSPKENVGRQRLISFAPQPSGRRSHELAKALSKYPRSPYPSAPLSPAEFEDPGGDVNRGRTQYRERGDMIKSLPARARARAKSLEEERKLKRQVTPLSNVAPRQFKAGLLSPFMPAPSPLSRTFLAANQEPTLARANKPPPLPLVEPVSSNLSHAFWQSVSLEDSTTQTLPSPAFPESVSVSGSEGSAEALPTRPSRGSEQMMFASKDGALWSPRVATHEPPAGMLSPAQKVAFRNFSHSMVASPSPNDPFAAFPSFSVVLSGSGTSGVAPIAYPPRAKVGRASERV